MDTLNRILDLLKAKGKSQKELAEILGLGKQSISEWKSGKSVSYKKFNIFKLFRPGDITVLLAVPIPTDLFNFSMAF